MSATILEKLWLPLLWLAALLCGVCADLVPTENDHAA
jgi:hypothetical protein